jgi:hypothetical protein
MNAKKIPSKKALKKIKHFLVEKKEMNAKMATAHDLCGFAKTAKEYNNAVKKLKHRKYHLAKKILRQELKKIKNIARAFGEGAAQCQNFLCIQVYAKELLR